MAPTMSLAACSMFSAIIILAASSGSCSETSVPRYRSGASATNPSAAYRSHTSLIC